MAKKNSIICFFISFIFFVSCRNEYPVRNILVCKDYSLGMLSARAEYDSIVVEYATSSLSLIYYSSDRKLREENYISKNGFEYYFSGEIRDLNSDSVGSYEYLFFSPKDTSFFYTYSENDAAVPIPQGSRDAKIDIYKTESSVFSLRKFSRLGNSLEIFECSELFAFSYPFTLHTVRIVNDKGTFLYEDKVH